MNPGGISGFARGLGQGRKAAIAKARLPGNTATPTTPTTPTTPSAVNPVNSQDKQALADQLKTIAGKNRVTPTNNRDVDDILRLAGLI